MGGTAQLLRSRSFGSVTISEVSPFGRQRPPAPTDEERRAAEVDLERIRQGGIPLGAEERLKRVATASTPFFTSDLSAKEYALAQASGLQPVAQVMGSSVVQHGWLGAQRAAYVGDEIPALSDPWNLARSRAFDRLRQEAELAGADGVIGIDMNAGSLGKAGSIELVVFGTAVRDSTLTVADQRPAGDQHALRSGRLQAAPDRRGGLRRGRSHDCPLGAARHELELGDECAAACSVPAPR